MYKVKLIKGRSYTGAVRSTKKAPFAEVKEKETADALVASGYFELVEIVGTDDVAENGKNKTKRPPRKRKPSKPLARQTTARRNNLWRISRGPLPLT